MKHSCLFFLFFYFHLLVVSPIFSFAQNNFWQPTNGPYGGTVLCFAIDSNGNIFAGTANGVYRSTDDGLTWTSAGISGAEIRSLTVNSKGDIFAGTGDSLVYRSVDHGKTWIPLHLGTRYHWVSSMVVGKEDIIFVGNYFGGVFRSTDNGNSWRSLGLNWVLSIAIKLDGTIFAGTSDGVYRSTNNGDSWQRVLLTNTEFNSIAINSRGIIFAGGVGGVYRSNDDGVTWARTNMRNAYFLSLTIDSNDAIFAAGSAGAGTMAGVFKSTDNGESWIPINNGLIDLRVSFVAISSKRTLLAGTFLGVFRSENYGESWTQAKLNTVYISTLGINHHGVVFVAADNGVHYSTDQGDTWKWLRAYANAFAFNSHDHVFIGTHDGVYRSANNGESWSTNEYWRYYSVSINSLAIDQNGNIYAAASRSISPCPCASGVYYSTDNGDTWKRTALTMSAGLVVVSPQGHIFAVSSAGLHRSSDQGMSWTPLVFILPKVYIHSLNFDSSGYMFAATDSGVFRSPDNGDTWTATGLQLVRVYSLAITSGNHIYAASDTGVYRSIDNGETWLQVNAGLTNLRIRPLGITPDGFIFAGTFGSSLFRSIDPVTSAKDQFVVPYPPFSLSQNYPNPFNPFTRIRYQLRKGANVKLTVYNTLGEQVEVLVDVNQKPGSYEVEFDGKALASGVYFYRLQTSDFVETQKMLLLR